MNELNYTLGFCGEKNELVTLTSARESLDSLYTCQKCGILDTVEKCFLHEIGVKPILAARLLHLENLRGARLTPPDFEKILETVMQQGAAHGYSANSWKQETYQHHLGHATQHFAAYMAGDRSEDHLGHCACRLLMAKVLDDQKRIQLESADDFYNILAKEA